MIEIKLILDVSDDVFREFDDYYFDSTKGNNKQKSQQFASHIKVSLGIYPGNLSSICSSRRFLS